MKPKLPLRVLLIETAPDDVAPLRTALEDISATCERVCADAIEGCVLRLESGGFDAILLCLVQPDADSLKSIPYLRQCAPEIPILVVSDLNDDELALAAIREGAQDYLLATTCDAHLLARAIRYAIERNRIQTTLRALSLRDDLTGIYNRRGFSTLARHQMRIAQRRQTGFYLIFIDLDDMKRINDTVGHLAGDQALIAIAQLLSHTFRGSDVVARLGGDEFAVITCNNETQYPDNATTAITTRLETAVARHNDRHLDEPSLSISYGVIFFDPAQNKTLDQTLLEADQIMYKNKQQKKNGNAQINMSAVT
jgi:diguanylate cyclase (GGDEF)-like protein